MEDRRCREEHEEKVILAFERDLQTGNSVESVHRSVVKYIEENHELFPTIFIKQEGSKNIFQRKVSRLNNLAK